MKRLLWTVFAVFPIIIQAETNKTAEKWMDDWLNLEIQKGQLQSGWNQRERDLDQHLSLLNIESERLKEMLAQRTEKTDEVDQLRSQLLEQQEELEQGQSRLKTQLETSLRDLKTLHPRLPPPLHSEWQVLLGQINPDTMTNSELLERVLALYKLLEEFDGRVALHRGTVELPGSGEPSNTVALVNQIYLGISQGWYVSDDGKAYGYGRATALGWRWWHGQDAQQELGHPLDPELVTRVRLILESPTTADFIALPVKISQ